jgi:hypothetical protein
MTSCLLAVSLLMAAMPALATEKSLTRADILRESTQRFERADLNHDGVVSEEERRLAQAAAVAGVAAPAPLPARAGVSITCLRASGSLPLLQF